MFESPRSSSFMNSIDGNRDMVLLELNPISSENVVVSKVNILNIGLRTCRKKAVGPKKTFGTRGSLKCIPIEWNVKIGWTHRLFDLLQRGFIDKDSPIFWSSCGLNICVRDNDMQELLLTGAVYKATKIRAFFRRLNEFGFRTTKRSGTAIEKGLSCYFRNEITSNLDCDSFCQKCTSNRRITKASRPSGQK